MKKIKPARFKDVEVSVPYTTYTNINSILRYKLLNNQLEIDLKSIIDTILKDAGITGFNTKQTLLTIPYDLDDAASGDTLTLLIDKRRFHIRLPEVQVVSNKQQKIDWDNTHPHRWTTAQWAKFIEKKFWDTYGFQSLELDLRGVGGAVKRGKSFSYIKTLIRKIKCLNGLSCDEDSVVEYIVWVFANKAQKTSLTLALLTCDSFIQEWVIWKKKKIKEQGKTADSGKEISDKWK